METILPEKARLLALLKKGAFNVPDFIYLAASDFNLHRFTALEAFLNRHRESFKVIVRSAHPLEHRLKGGTFDSLETYADPEGIVYARSRIIQAGATSKRLSLIRQQKFNSAPAINIDDMGIIVMPFIDGMGVMAKMLGNQWEFGYGGDNYRKIRTEPYITETPPDKALLRHSEDIQRFLGFRCEIEFIISPDRQICVVQAKDISGIDTLEQKESERSIRMDGIRRLRKRRNYRERPVYVMNNIALYNQILHSCSEPADASSGDPKLRFNHAEEMIRIHEKELRAFALKHERFAVLGLSIQIPEKLYQEVHHVFTHSPHLRKALSKTLHQHQYRIDYFLSEADTLIAKDKIRINLGTHDAYGIDTVRNPAWSVYWQVERHNRIVMEIRRIGFKTGDVIGIDIDTEEKPIVFRL